MARIIVVDDDRFVQAAIRVMLERQGFEVVLAEGGSAGLSALKDAAFDVALVDIFMADMDGLETISAMKELAPRMPIIAMSGFMDRGQDVGSWYFLGMASRLGAFCTLRKPFRPKELMAAIETCLGRQPREADDVPKETPTEIAKETFAESIMNTIKGAIEAAPGAAASSNPSSAGSDLPPDRLVNPGCSA